MLRFKLKRLKKLFEGLFGEIKGKVRIYYHRDGDGIFSAAIFSKMLENLGVEHSMKSFMYSSQVLEEDSTCVFLDCVPRKRIGERMIVIDHHVKEKTEADFYINFRDIFKKGRSNSFYLSVVYNLFWKTNSELYFATAYQDGALGECIDIIEGILGKEEVNRIYHRGFLNPFLRIIGDIPNLILCTERFNGEIIDLLKRFIEMGIGVFERYGDRIFSLLKELEKNIIKSIKIVKRVRRFGEKLVVVEMEDPEKLYRFLISYFILRERSKVYLFVKGKERVKISMRSRDVNLMKLMKKVEKDVNVSWGGHIYAIGGSLDRRDLDHLIDRILEVMR